MDVTFRAVAGTLSGRVRIATTRVPAVGALPLGFQRMLGMVRGGLHGCEGGAVSVTALSSFRSAIARAAGPVQHFRSAIWQAWQHKVATDLCKRKGFRGGFGVDIYGSHQLLVSSRFRERDKMLLRAILSGGVWNWLLAW